MKLAWRRQAIADLISIREFVARDNPAAARKVAAAIGTSAELLLEQPHIGRSGRVAGTRERVVPRTPYVIAYVASEKTVTILSVLHGARRWPDRF